ncbi:MAG: cryptochrome/photolyase family protein [Holosporales bacterium]
MTTLLWFEEDLRIHHHPALLAAIERQQPIVALYILPPSVGGAQKWWLHHSLSSLSKSLQQMGISLILRRGQALDVLRQVVDETKASALFWSRRYTPSQIARDREIKTYFQEQGLTAKSFPGYLLFEPWLVKTQAGTPYKVFSQFWKNCLQLPEPQLTEAPPHHTHGGPILPSETLDDWDLLPSKPNWATRFGEFGTPGEQGAMARAQAFFEHRLADYAEARDRPDVDGTSRLSAHLHFGEISPHLLWHAAKAKIKETKGPAAKSLERFLAELGWREFSYHLLYHFPTLVDQPFRPEFAEFPWHDNPSALTAWQQGQTGFPIIDAAMRQLWHTGWMHNRVRMIVASFLTKNLLVPWQQGAAWFWDTLVDADLANNSASWQWVAGCGADAAPYFRIFNPVLQAERFDPEGTYVRQWVPELRDLPRDFIHQPWEAPALVLRAAGIRLGETYPERLIDHATSRDRALEAYEAIKKNG